MIRLLTDNDFDGRVIRGLFLRRPALDLLRVQDIGLAGIPDPEVLEWAAAHDRVVATRDRSTMIGYAFTRVEADEPMPGLIVAAEDGPVAAVIDDLLLIVDCLDPAELAGRVEYIPY